jgi:hypothetical protein
LGTTSWIVNKVHEFRITVRAALKRCTILDEMPEESSFHVCIAFANDVDLGSHQVSIGGICVFIFSQRMHNRTKTNRKVVATVEAELDLVGSARKIESQIPSEFRKVRQFHIQATYLRHV